MLRVDDTFRGVTSKIIFFEAREANIFSFGPWDERSFWPWDCKLHSLVNIQNPNANYTKPKYTKPKCKLYKTNPKQTRISPNQCERQQNSTTSNSNTHSTRQCKAHSSKAEPAPVLHRARAPHPATALTSYLSSMILIRFWFSDFSLYDFIIKCV